MDTIIISDDLSGAAGMASLIGTGFPVIPFKNINVLGKMKFSIISLDIETRNTGNAGQRLDYVKELYPEAFIFTRIDTMLRGSTSDFIEFMCKYAKLLITDTIPDFERYTYNGLTIQNESKLPIRDIIPVKLHDSVIIADSRTYNDIEKLAKRCLNENLLPVDPGIMIKLYLEMR
jgi:hypothetical protein